ncbi:MAG: cytochrome P450 [Cytophagaceae bacterium]|nr:cytochrome P450 [Gemmatimonadaceae bacterium]
MATLHDSGSAATPVPLIRPKYPGELVLRLVRNPLEHFTRLAREHGDVVHVRMGREHIYLVSHPDLVREVLVGNQRNFKKGRALERARLLLGDGLLTSEGEHHLRHRRMIQPEFHRQHVAQYADTMVEVAARRTATWRDGAPVDMHKEMSAVALSIASQTLFGADVGHESEEIGAALEATFGTFMRTFYMPFGDLVLRLPIPSSRRFWQGAHRVQDTVNRLIAERRASGEDRPDLLSLLLRARDVEGDGGGMTDDEVRDEVLTFFLAGHETTANALTWSWVLLAAHPEVADRMAAEARAGGDGPLTAEHLPRLPYTRMVLSESMRLYPPAWTVARRALGDFTLGTHRIPANALVVTSQWVIQRDPRWWPDPDRFDPERWRPELAVDRPKFAYFPFGGGARMCIGEHFAWMEGILVLATIARQWHFDVRPGTTVTPHATITLRPRGGAPMTVHRRTNT